MAHNTTPTTNTKQVLLLTASYPYGEGEQFLEKEVPFWAGTNLTILPASTAGGHLRNTPPNVAVSNRCAVLDSRWSGIMQTLWHGFVGGLFFREIRRRPDLLSGLKPIKALILEVHFARRLQCALSDYIDEEISSQTDTVLYSYWFSWPACAAALVATSYANLSVICRAHRHDLYEYARAGNYMPLGKSYHTGIERIYSVSEDGRQYLKEKYSIPASKLRVSRLGVDDPGCISLGSGSPKEIRLLSISYAKPVKRLNRVIDGILYIQTRHPDLEVRWSHIGGGPELEPLQNQCARHSIDAVFHGQLPNSEVISYLENQKIDVFVNVSESEGVPVSIMEAMSFGIPVVATDVGGTREILTDLVGRLLPRTFTDQQFANAVFEARSIEDRQAVRAHFDRCCNAATVFPDFVAEVLADIPGASAVPR